MRVVFLRMEGCTVIWLRIRRDPTLHLASSVSSRLANTWIFQNDHTLILETAEMELKISS